ncbi:MAG: Asp-tRNA(Asn)/Glu-tRNA(Gln) amidotransferase subunit GatB [Candidatus Coatesbacteria bacterium]|nr:Asp-tRNA(Asn)/Glu-tRNA(Gln) amidotransferase subunit GatB [Candidatus Coatesbacteria bacterium]
MTLRPVIGIEVHVQLLTKSKIFCSCSTEFGASPNSNTCPVCLGLPGVLPVLNKRSVELAIKAALALNCEIMPRSQFARKNYFYPDLTKGFQITQFALPLATGGYISIDAENGSGQVRQKRIRINRLHLEEDSGKSLHNEEQNLEGTSLIDFNRCGVPLIEIVTEPDLESPEEARQYLLKLKTIMDYCGVSDCNMEEGSLRCDANISLRSKDGGIGTKCEIKNLNSFRFAKRALEYEMTRQQAIIGAGEAVKQATYGFNAASGKTFLMRSKEEAHDYRYFPEPDLVFLDVTQDWIAAIRATIPELPDARRNRLVEQYGIPEYDSSILTSTQELADYFERCASLHPDGKAVSNWVMSSVLRVVKERNISLRECLVTPEYLAELLTMVRDGKISGKIAKDVFERVVETGRTPAAIIAEQNLSTVSDEGTIAGIVREVAASRPDLIQKLKQGKLNVLGFFVGQVMQRTKGQADPQIVNETVRKVLLED